jgi:putative ABC transport system permease protein
MLLSQNFQVAIRALVANKMRSVLTMLGIVIGVGSVVALLAIGSGATSSITGSVQGVGSNLVFISPGKQSMNRNPTAGGSTAYLYLNDYQVIKAQTAGETKISPMVSSMYSVKSGNQTFDYSISGVTEDYLSIRAYTIASGRNINAADRNTQAQVTVLGSSAATDLFGTTNPLGKPIKINGVRFQVIGVLTSKGASGMQNGDSIILIPLETGYAKLFGTSFTNNGNKTVSTIMMSINDPKQVDTVMNKVEYLLRREHHLKASEDSDFSILSQKDMLSLLSTVSSTLTIFLGAIAGISLLVGGIGIMNIMLVSVTERTKEIGLRKAVGAKKSQILTQFLVETMTLSILGGIIGILFGMGIAWVVTALKLITAQVSINSILLAFGFSAAIGLFFGMYPAYRAAGLHPMDALRYE